MITSRLRVWLLLGLTVALGAAAAPFVLTMQDHDVSLVEYQLARTSQRAAELNGMLGGEGLDALRASLWWDLPFLVCLGALLAILCLRSAAGASGRGQRRLAAAGRPFAAMAALYTLCDAVEDALLFQVADGETGQPWPGLTFAFASVKFLALFACLGYLFTVLLLSRQSLRATDKP
jgi:hypothetical protein